VNKEKIMYTFVCADEFNDEVSNDTIIIRHPDFMEEIKSCERFKGSFSKTTVNYLRSIASEFGNKYDKEFNGYRNIIPTDFQGIPFSSYEEVSTIVKSMFNASYPKIFKSYLESKIRNRPFNCDNVVVVGFDRPLVLSVMESFDFVEASEEPIKEVEINEPLTVQDDQELLQEMITGVNHTEDDVKPKKTNKKKSVHS